MAGLVITIRVWPTGDTLKMRKEIGGTLPPASRKPTDPNSQLTIFL
jgi:hypothetical protein